MERANQTAPSLLAILRRPPSLVGVVGGMLFWWHSLAPSMLPRAWFAQALVSALSFGVGYMTGALVGFLGGRLLARLERSPSPRTRRIAWGILAAGVGALVVAGLVLWPRWQNAQRDLIADAHISPLLVVPIIVVTVVLLAVLAAAGRVVWHWLRTLDRFARRYLPFPLALAATITVTLVGTNFAVRGVAFDWFVDQANEAFGTIDTTTEEGVVRPTSLLVSGGPASLVPWDTLGRQGRTFVAGVTTIEELIDFHGPDVDVEEPIRAYAGLRSADTTETRAELALAELERAGAFDREVLVVATATGTGWVDPDAATAIEQLYAGDTAFASIQYSYLPSWISFLVDLDVASEAGAALFETVYERWSTLPEHDRPDLLVFGESLGSLGAEAAFAGVDARSSLNNLEARADGALFVGPVESNPIWSDLVAERDEGSPVWRPVFDDATVRVANRVTDLIEPDPSWEPPRFLYVYHPSDPVAMWNWETLRSPPEWLDHPRGYDVPDRGSWFPFVTFAQQVADLVAGLASPPGFGHDYSDVFVPAWATVAPPEGWTVADSRRLMDYLGTG